MAKIDSGLGWKVDEQFYIYDAGAHTYESYYKENDGAAIIAIVYKASTNYGYPVMISTVADYADDNNYTPASATVNGITWYGVRENSRLWEEEITIGGVARMPNDDIDPYDWFDSEDIRKAIITAIITQAGVEYIPKVTTTDYVKGYVEGVVSGNNTLILDALDDILTDDTAYPSSEMITIPDCKVPSNAAVSVEFEPIQDLHGYSNPWAPGGGKNLLESKTTDDVVVNNGITYTKIRDANNNIVAIDVNGKATDYSVYIINNETRTSFSQFAGKSCVLTGCPSGNGYYIQYWNSTSGAVRDIGSGVSINFAQEAPNAWNFVIGVDNGVTVSHLKFYPMLRLASDPDSTFAPYSNICSISGRNNISITRTGKNLLNDEFMPGRINSDGTITQSDECMVSKYFSAIQANTDYVLSQNGTGAAINIAQYDTDYNFIDIRAYNLGAFKSAVNAKYVKIYGNNDDISNGKWQLEVGSTPTTYTPYTGVDYTLSLNGTRYGGRVNISDTGEAVLTVNKGYATLKWGEYLTTADLTNCTRRQLSAIPTARGFYVGTSDVSDIMPVVASYTLDASHFYIDKNTKVVVAFLPIGTSSDTEINVCYELETPFQIPLESTPIKLENGTNNLYSDAGNISATVNSLTSAVGALTEQVNDITLYPAPPTTDGTYTLQVTVASGVPTYTWAAVNRSAPAVNEPDEELKKSEDSGNISEENENSKEKEIDISEKDVSGPAEKKEDIPDEMIENKIDENSEIKNDEKAKTETDLENW